MGINKNIFNSARLKKAVLMLYILLITILAYSQKIAVKTNLLYDATTTFNLGLEFGLSPRWTLDLSGNYNPWTFSANKKWKHWLIQPEFRYWFCEKFNGHFLGAHLLGGQFNFGHIKTSLRLFHSDFSGLRDYRYEGWAAGGGIVYGYSWILSRHWNLEAALGIGYLYAWYDKYKCQRCGEKIEGDKKHNYFGPTKAAVNLIYVF